MNTSPTPILSETPPCSVALGRCEFPSQRLPRANRVMTLWRPPSEAVAFWKHLKRLRQSVSLAMHFSVTFCTLRTLDCGDLVPDSDTSFEGTKKWFAREPTIDSEPEQPIVPFASVDATTIR